METKDVREGGPNLKVTTVSSGVFKSITETIALDLQSGTVGGTGGEEKRKTFVSYLPLRGTKSLDV